MASEHDDRNVRVATVDGGAEDTHELDALEARHRIIANHQIDTLDQQRPEGLRPAPDANDRACSERPQTLFQ